ncbi:MAG: tRNA lysidine(34) synthetase TilS [Rhodocyclaceae bacterium]|nr:tRNA lysidine(34) synthetase TilS [Rhodocyclaceae bacterium]
MASSRNSPATEDRSDWPSRAAAACLGRHVRPGQHLVLGLSGGLDSVSMLHVLASLRQAGGFGLSALHVHHGLSAHADDWARFCAQSCAALDVPFGCRRVTVERNSRDGLEAAARRARHAAWATVAADWIVLAHHRDDQAETMLFNLLRGTGLAGAAAMRERSGRLLRPWLAVGRAEIAAYAQRHGLTWVEDESNADTRHSRNFLRRKIFPELVQRFPAAANNFAAASTRFAEACDLLDELARLDLGAEDDFPLSVATLAALSEPRARNALRYVLAARQVRIPSEARLREVLHQFLTAAPDRHPSATFGPHRLRRRCGMIYLESVGP